MAYRYCGNCGGERDAPNLRHVLVGKRICKYCAVVTSVSDDLIGRLAEVVE